MMFFAATLALFALTPPAPPPTRQINPEKYTKLLDWLKEQHAQLHPSLEIKPSTSAEGYGAFVGDQVASDEILFTIPRSACITLDAALSKEASNDGCNKAFEKIVKNAGPGGSTVVLAGFMTKEYLKAMSSLGDVFFGPYLSVLPWERGTNNQEHMLFWSDEMTDNLLNGTMCYVEAKDLRGEVKFATTVINGIVGKAVRKFRSGEDTNSRDWRFPWEAPVDQPSAEELVEGLSEAVKGAFVCLLTRSFEDEETGEEKLVPMLDMLQHSREPNVRHRTLDDGTVEVRARTDLKAGEELFNQYKAEEEETMPFHRFFTRFGFVPGINEPITNLLVDKSSIFFAQRQEV